MGNRLGLRLGSIRARTTVAACVVVAAALIIGALLVLVVLRRSLVANVDSAARTRAQDVAALVRQGTLPTTLAVPGNEDALVQVVDTTGKVVSSSANLDGQEPITTFKPTSANSEARTLRDLPIGEHASFRVVALGTDSASGPVVVYVATSLEQLEESVDTVRQILVLGLPLLLALVGGTSWVIVGGALRPVESIRSQVADISAHDLSRRVPVPAVDDEVGRLARTMNDMLDRLQRFTELQRRFLADASHELRSPIASSRAELEVALANPSSNDWMTTASELLDDNERMERLVRDLLFLARVDDPSALLADDPVDLDEIVREEVRRLAPRSRVRIDTTEMEPAEVQGSADQLARVVRNVLENAERHARAQVTVQLRTVEGVAILVIGDDGPGVAQEDRERIFDRFTRIDSSRTRETGGTGLGLAIARETVQAHGGRVFVQDSEIGASFVVELPSP